ncbi:MAG: ABC transporter ATP-binding protein [Bryobacteraceae bacterium]
MLELIDVSKNYETVAGPLRILESASLRAGAGDSISIMGPSGSGKSTLLSILGVLEPPSSGTVTLDGQNPFSLPEAEQAAFRNRSVGFVFQDHCLLPQCTVLENVIVPTLAAAGGANHAEAEARARKLLDRVGLGGRLTHLPSQLSGGEKQRVAIARALIREPKLLLCDEPTGNLDRASSDSAADLLFGIHREQRVILIIVTHSEALAAKAARQYELTAGRLEPRDAA